VVKTKLVIILLIVFSIIGIIHGVILSSINVFVTWLLIGVWLILSFKVLQNIKQYREYNSPHNTAFFTIIPVFISIFYSIWGNFTGLLGENILVETNLYLSWWGILFGLPYLIYSSISLYRSAKLKGLKVGLFSLWHCLQLFSSGLFIKPASIAS